MNHPDPTRDGGQFELFAADGGYRFRLVSDAHGLLLSSGPYASPDAALRDIDHLRHSPGQFGACMSADGRFYFTCSASTGESLATSPMFEVPNERDAAQAVAAGLVRPDVPVVLAESRG